jgi:hypothetical protein
MTEQTAIVANTDTDNRWREWQTRGAEDDRRTAKRMRGLMVLVAAGLLVWLAVQLA